MRPSGKNAVEIGSAWGHRSHAADVDRRLAAALEFGEIRAIASTLVFEVRTFNPLSGRRHLLELKHEIRNGNDRYNLYIDSVCQRNQWSRWGFVTWMFRKIESVRNDFAYEMSVRQELEGSYSDRLYRQKKSEK